MILAQRHLLCDQFNVSKYVTVNVTELVAMEYGGVTYVLYYTPSASFVPQLFKALTALCADNPQREFVFCGDANSHNPDWIPSSSPLDQGGVDAEIFAKVHSLKQLVDFPTRDGNTLDLIFSSKPGTAAPIANLGTSDHLSVSFCIQVNAAAPPPPPRPPVRNWELAP